MAHGFDAYRDKAQLLEEICAGLNVVHLGVTGEGPVAQVIADAPHGYHALITRVAKQCVGIEINEAAVRAVTDAGLYDNVLIADATALRRKDIPMPSVDVIVAGDIIEHLSDPGSLLKSCERMADPESRLVLTTPNASSLPAFVRYLRGRPLEGEGHVVSFNRYSLANLLRDFGWTAERWATCYQLHAGARHGVLKVVIGRRLFEWWPALGGTLFAVAHRAR